MAYVDLLTRLSQAYGVSGYEHNIRDILREYCQPFVDRFEDDALGNLMMVKKGSVAADEPRYKIMLAAHTDEIGGMVTKIDRGILYFTRVGGLDHRQLFGQEVTVFGRNGREFHGVVASRPPHFATEDRNTFPQIEEYQIDLGLPAAEVEANIRVGDWFACRKEPQTLLGDRMSGKAMDDRASVVAVVVCLEHLSRMQHQWDVYAVASSQEEVGVRGATTSAYHINPDAAIAIDVTFARVPGVAPGHDTELGKGPAMAVGANLHPGMCAALRETAAKLEINLQIEAIPGQTGTDAWAIQTARDGVPTALLGLPLRYMHSAIETVHLKDIERTGRLMAQFIADLDADFIAKLTPSEGLEDDHAA